MTPPLEQVFLAQPIGTGKAQIIATPFQFEFTGEDQLQLLVLSSVTTTVALTMRFINADGEINVAQHPLAVTGNRTIHNLKIPMGRGYASNVAVRPVLATIQTGQCYCVVFVGRGGLNAPLVVIGQMLGGYATLFAPLAWPGSPIIAPSEGLGVFRVVDLGTPAAGAELTATVPLNTRWAPLGLRGFFTAAVAATQRFIGLQYNDAGSGVAIGRYAQPNPHPDGVSRTYTWARGLEMHDDPAGAGSMQAALPTETTLPSGTLIRTSTLAIQPTDQWDFGFLTVQEWLAI